MGRRLATFVVIASGLVACNAPVPSLPASLAPTGTARPAPASDAPSGPPRASEEPTDAPDNACGLALAAGDPRGSTSKPVAVFSSRDGLFLYDIQADAVTALEPSASQHGRTPRFRSPSVVSFVMQRQPADDAHTFGQDSIYELDIDRKRAEETIRLPARVLAFDWNPDGTELAYLTERGDQSANLLCTLDAQSGTTRLVRTFSYTVGRGVHQWDEVSVSWAPATGAILVVQTTTEPPNVHVVDTDGRDLVAPQTGTFGRWLADNAILFLEGEPQATAQPWHWSSVSVTTGQKHDYGLPDEAFRPALSPNGRSIAFDDGAEEPSIHVFDVESGATRRLTRGYVGPVWLDPDLIAATAAGPCPTSDFCVLPWSPSDATIGVEPTSRDQRPLTLPTTLQGLVMNGAIDVIWPVG